MLDSVSVHASSLLSRMSWTATKAISMDKSEKERRDEAWGTTHSATGAFIALRDEGLKVVGAVSSEKAIPYLAKIPRGGNQGTQSGS
jgi:hypothetical protein